MIVNQQPYRDISLRFGVGVMAVQRHRKHIETELRQVQEVQKIQRGTKLAERIFVNQQRIEDALQRARNSADLRSEAALLKLEQGNMDLEAKITGAYKQPAINPQDRAAELNLLIEEIQDRSVQADQPLPSRLDCLREIISFPHLFENVLDLAKQEMATETIQ